MLPSAQDTGVAEDTRKEWPKARDPKLVVASSLVSSVFFLVSCFTPPLPGLCTMISLFTPLPLIYVFLRSGISKGLMGILGAFVFIGAVQGPFAGIQFLLAFGLLSFVLSLFLLRNVSIAASIFASTLIVSVAVAVAIIAYSSLEDGDPLGAVRRWIAAFLTQITTVLEHSSIPAEEVMVFREKQQALVELLISILPAVVVSFMSVISLVNITVLNRIHVQRGWPRPVSEDLTRWRAPEALVWVLLVAGFTALFQVEGFSVLALNVVLLVGVVYFFQGLAIVAYFFKTRRIPRYVTAVTYVLLFTQLPLTLLVAVTGLFDLWANFRRI